MTGFVRTRRSIHNCISVRASRAQLALLRRAAKLARVPVEDFVLESAHRAAVETLLGQQTGLVSDREYSALLRVLERPAQDNPNLRELLNLKAPWEE